VVRHHLLKEFLARFNSVAIEDERLMTAEPRACVACQIGGRLALVEPTCTSRRARRPLSDAALQAP